MDSRKQSSKPSGKPSHYKQPGNKPPGDAPVKVLQFHNPEATHLERWRAHMETDAGQKYGKLSSIFITDSYPAPTPLPKVEKPLDDTSDPGGIERQYLKELVSAKVREDLELRSNKPKLFALMLNSMSMESTVQVKRRVTKDALDDYDRNYNEEIAKLEEAKSKASKKKAGGGKQQREDDEEEAEEPEYEPPSAKDCWDLFKERGDPLELWKIIKATHLSSRTQSSRGDRDKASQDFADLRMGKQESIDNFKQRWDALLEVMVATGASIPSVEDQVTKFIRTLDRGRYGQFRVECINREAAGDQNAWPHNVDNAYLRAANFKQVRVVPSESDDKPAAVFIANAGDIPKKKKKDKSEEQPKAGGAPARKSESGKSQSKPKKPCPLCDEMHWYKDCPHLLQCRELVQGGKEDTTNIVLPVWALSSSRSNFTSDVIVLDNASGPNIFRNKDLLSNLRAAREPLSLNGINAKGPRLVAIMEGTYGPFRDIYYHPDAAANVISFGYVEDNFDVTYVNREKFIVHAQDKDYEFIRHGKHWIYDTSSETFLTNVSERESDYSKRDVQAARTARVVAERLAFPSEGELANTLRMGGINNIPITTADVARSYKIYGPSVAELKGKTTQPSPSARDTEVITNLLEPTRAGTLSIDIFTVNGANFLLGVLDEISLCMVSHLTSKSGPSIQKVLDDFLKTTKENNWRVRVRSDGEKGVGSIAKLISLPDDTGIETVGPGTHVPTVERKIRVIKERARGIINTLPFKSPKFLLKWIVYFVVSRLNLINNKSANNTINDNRSPREIFYGRRTDFNRDLRVSFGEYVQAYDPNIAQLNSMSPRTRGAIALLPTGNARGSVKFWCLSTNKIITRDKWTPQQLHRTLWSSSTRNVKDLVLLLLTHLRSKSLLQHQPSTAKRSRSLCQILQTPRAFLSRK